MRQRLIELETEVANGKEAMLKMERAHASFESQVQIKEVRLRGELKFRESIASVSSDKGIPPETFSTISPIKYSEKSENQFRRPCSLGLLALFDFLIGLQSLI
jgi:hypothetical protein